MKRSNLSKVISMAALSAVLLTGCGSAKAGSASAPPSTPAADNTTSAQSTTETSAAASTTETAASGISGQVTAAGSSALLPLAQAAAEKFMTINPDCTVTVNGGGSGEGLKQVAEGSIDIGNSDVFAEEKLDADKAGSLVDHQVCTMTVAPIVNGDLGVDNLTKQQLIDVFTGKVTNWKDVGGPDQDIVLVSRPSSSGTRALFEKFALDGNEEASNSALETDDSGTLLQTIEQTEGSVGYVALSYLVNPDDKVKAVSIDGVEPNLENTYNGTYTVWGYEGYSSKIVGSRIHRFLPWSIVV